MKHHRDFVPKVSSVFEDIIITDVRLMAFEDNDYFKANGTFQSPGIYFTYEMNGKKYKWNYKILSRETSNEKVFKYCNDLFSTLDPKNPGRFESVLNNIFNVNFYKDITWLSKFTKNPNKVITLLKGLSDKDKTEIKTTLQRTKSFVDKFNNTMQDKVIGKRTKVKVSSYSARSNKAKSPQDQDCLLTFKVSSYNQVNNQSIISSASKTIQKTKPFIHTKETIENYNTVPF